MIMPRGRGAIKQRYAPIAAPRAAALDFVTAATYIGSRDLETCWLHNLTATRVWIGS